MNSPGGAYTAQVPFISSLLNQSRYPYLPRGMGVVGTRACKGLLAKLE